MYTQEDVDQVNSFTMQEIKGKINILKCLRREDLPEGTELIIKSLQQTVFRKRVRYVLEFENLDSLYLSNYWLEKEIKDTNKDLNYKLKLN